ncbi:hypothetical protein Taro_013671 [Colocasia esculenta]|uniref:Uncharacterized protein n=1 Tax=Colocasia esculenta TaxID=4460 RepID=A0A843UH56_COLES|nr:hypothetical protein [Colocasia esculenta]
MQGDGAGIVAGLAAREGRGIPPVNEFCRLRPRLRKPDFAGFFSYGSVGCCLLRSAPSEFSENELQPAGTCSSVVSPVSFFHKQVRKIDPSMSKAGSGVLKNRVFLPPHPNYLASSAIPREKAPGRSQGHGVEAGCAAEIPPKRHRRGEGTPASSRCMRRRRRPESPIWWSPAPASSGVEVEGGVALGVPFRGEFPPGGGFEGGMELNVPILSCSEVMERLKESQEMRSSDQQYLAMYSSISGGITTDPAAMVIPMDDHMVHRGHGVFDTATIEDGYLYELDNHLDRFLRSASMAKINLPFDLSSMRSILVQTVSASKCRKGSLRYWLSAGPGDFLLSSSGCHKSAFYAIVIHDQSPSNQKGVKVITSTIPIKSPQFAAMKSVNYLPNVLSKMEAEEHGAYVAIWLDDEGYIAEGPNMNVAFVTEQRELVMPHFDKILSGCTARRILVLAERLVLNGTLSRVGLCNMTVEEGKMVREMMLIGSGVLVKPILQWDESIIGDGKEGPVAQSLLDLLLEDMRSGPADVRTPVDLEPPIQRILLQVLGDLDTTFISDFMSSGSICRIISIGCSVL